MKQEAKKRNGWIRAGRILLKTLLWIFFLILVIFVLILTPPVQQFLRKRVVAYLENKLDTKVEVGRIYVGIPRDIVLENIYLEDRQKDTLFAGGKIMADIDLWGLITKNEININSVSLNKITAHVKRELPDTTYNFQFIIDAFAPADTSANTDTTTSSSPAINIGTVELNNIRLLYKDVITGSDMEASLAHLYTRVKTFDMEHSRFEIPETRIHGLTARVYQLKPLAEPEPEAKDSIEAKQPSTLDLALGSVNLQKIKLDYRNDISATYSDINIGLLNLESKQIDLDNRVLALEDFSLENTQASIRLGKKDEAKIVEKEVKQEAKSQVEAGWKIVVNTLDLDNNSLRFDNDNSPRLKQGMDYSHLNAKAFTLQAKDLMFGVDSMSGAITKASFTEQSGFTLNELRTEFLYTQQGAQLRDLYLKTPGTELKRNAAIRYASVESLAKDIGNMQVDLDIANSKIRVSDLLVFVPALRQQPPFANSSDVWHINSRVTGRVADLTIDALQIKGDDTRIDVKGTLSGMPDMKNIRADLTIRDISSTRNDVASFLPKNTLPPSVVLPARFALKGTIKGTGSRMDTDLALDTDLGDAIVKGSFSQLDDPNRMGYNAKIETRSLDLGTLLQNKEMLGPLTATVTIKGTGLDPQTADAEFDGMIHSALINQYRYHDVKLDGRIANQKASLATAIADSNIRLDLKATADITGKYPAVQVDGMIDSIKLQPLHFTSDQMIYRGKITADFPVTHPDSLQGKLLLTRSIFVHNEQRVQLDTLQLLANRSGSGQYLQLISDVMTAKLEGRYRLTELGTIFQQAIQPYFAILPADSVAATQPYDFTFNAYVLDNPALKVFMPGLQKIDSVSLQSHFSSENGWTASIKAPALDMGPNKIRNMALQVGTDQGAIKLVTTIQSISSGPDIAIDNTTLKAAIANNTIDFGLNIKDKKSRDKYNVNALLEQPQFGQFQFSLKPDSLVLNYDIWTVSDNNRILLAPEGINARNVQLSQRGQQLKVNSLGTQLNAPMEVNLEQFRLATLTGFVQTDSTFANGILNGKITFKELGNEPIFTGDLTVNDFSLRGDTVGNVRIQVNNTTANTYAADIMLSGRGNDVRLAGNYYLNTGTSNFDFDLDIRQLPMTTAQVFSNDMIRNATGALTGKFDVQGTMAKPIVKGDLFFNKAGFNFSMLNSQFSIDGEKIEVDEQGLHFNQFEIKDAAQNALRIDGLAATSNFVNYQFDLDIRANDFQALNSTKKDNKLFWGQLYFNTNLSVKGTEAAPVIDGRLLVNEKTKMTVVLPQSEPGVVEREGIVDFVDMDATPNDSLFMAAYDSLNTASFTGMDISVNIQIDKQAEFNLIIDEGNGDFLNVKGEAVLTAGIDPSGAINMAGSYELEQGSYELTFNFIRRKFDIKKGSRIVWEGEPTKATVDVEAMYVANAAPLDLVKNQLEEASTYQRNTYLQKLPFDVHLKMEGELLRPAISFDIILPEDKNYAVGGDIITTVRTKLDQLRQEPAEMNKQVFSLLLLNRFVAENPFNSSGGAFNAEVMARQSVSKLLTEQLNRLADDLIAGVDLNFDVVSSEDYTTGERADRTDLNVGLSKQLLNDRLTVSVGSNFELEGPANSNQQTSNIAGNIALDYRVSRDNRYLLRAYRKNEYQGVIDGYIIETGVGFIITVDYNRFKELFVSKRERDKRRRMRQQQRELEEQQKKNQQTTTIGAPNANN